MTDKKMNAPEHIVARFAISEDDRGLILGKTINAGELKLGHLYQIENVLDTLIIRDLGLSSATNGDKYSTSWNHDANWMINSGDHLFTATELEARYKYERAMRDLL